MTFEEARKYSRCQQESVFKSDLDMTEELYYLGIIENAEWYKDNNPVPQEDIRKAMWQHSLALHR